MENFTYSVASPDNIHIVDSYLIRKKDFKPALHKIHSEHPEHRVLLERNWNHVCLEWACHNFLYSVGVLRSHTKDVDINTPLKWYAKIAYAVCGVLCWPFTR